MAIGIALHGTLCCIERSCGLAIYVKKHLTAQIIDCAEADALAYEVFDLFTESKIGFKCDKKYFAIELG